MCMCLSVCRVVLRVDMVPKQKKFLAKSVEETYYGVVPRSLTICNHNLPTQTDTLILEFPKAPIRTNIYIQNQAKALFLLYWSHVQIHGGSGGIDVFATQAAKLGESRVIVVAGDEERLSYCESMGAHVCINYRIEDFASITSRYY
ncbi:uncharacterized protein LOC131606550 [Vicia villosa]|uniref:uncharacterized protein LOC131606550 n=1 Tax=Vicia villosa TaxID=3911 RepID=UPI00273CAEE6|nr:uncharacterized protein LOC131606550 [Vicia villosa]XP_058734738.1 uncharacterized protein LOC131606550 [Vicia villosa]XP_058734739.1 uncharacterized protein LOC131606550 [Vicia villosa]XP_058734740.1 uncharacterized protein LOC131606550 [Vicia villosa]